MSGYTVIDVVRCQPGSARLSEDGNGIDRVVTLTEPADYLVAMERANAKP